MNISSEIEDDDSHSLHSEVSAEILPGSSKKLRAKRSAVHTQFVIENKKWKCVTCDYSCNMVGTTTSQPLRHLRSDHPELCQSNEDITSLAEDFSTEVFHGKLVDTVVSECLPFSIVESPWLKDIFQYCHPDAVLPTRLKLKKDILEKFEFEKTKLIKKLEKHPGKISCVIDNWTSSNMHPFQGVIIQYVSSNWEICSTVLDLTLIEGSHTGVNLATALIKVLEDFKILNKLIAVTTDNATNNNTMMQELSQEMLERGYSFDYKNNRVRCFAHIVNLACAATLEELKAVSLNKASDSEEQGELLLPKLRKGINIIRMSNLKREAFRDNCKSVNTKHNELILDVKTRWNSTYNMIKRCLKLQVPYKLTLNAETESSKYALTDEEIEILEQLRIFLKPFKTATKDISNNSFPTISLCTLLYVGLFKHLEIYFPNPANKENPMDIEKNKPYPEWIQKAAASAWNKLTKYYPSSDSLVYVVGSIMDPRCKLNWFEEKFNPEVVEKYKSIITLYWTSNYKPTVEEVNQFSPEKSKNAWVRHLYNSEKINTKPDELEIYLTEKTSINYNKTALDWWKLHEDEYPNLSKMARDFLHISGSGVPVECLFSNGPDLLRNRRQSLSDESITKCICLKLWLGKCEEGYTAGKAAAEKMGGL